LKNLEESIFPIGRLDRNTTGLLLFTNDGDLANKISHPQFEIPKVYKVTLDKPISVRDQKRLLTGILLEDGPVVFSKIELLDEAELLVTISEGRNRIVRRTFQQLSYEVKKLKRLSIGPIQLGGLAEGKFIKLSRPELNDLQRIT
jgi:23S rRNA pseudouridine2605 synthase